MSIDHLKAKVSLAIEETGYPLELKAANFLEIKRWAVFHSVSYPDLVLEKNRELDLLAYKIINGRRVELHISCKKSREKQWIFFTVDKNKYLEHGSLLKVVPLISSQEVYRKLPEILNELLFFKAERLAVNFTVTKGDKALNESREQIREGILSSINSVMSFYPHGLLRDPRGTIHFFVTLFEGNMYESFIQKDGTSSIKEIDHVLFDQKLSLPFNCKYIKNEDGRNVELSDALYLFNDWFRSQIVTYNFFEELINNMEKTFLSLDSDEISIFGKEWIPENFPKKVKTQKEIEKKVFIKKVKKS